LQAIVKSVAGRVIKTRKVSALWVNEFHPESKAGELIYLRFAFVLRGPGDHIFPSFILDDWGREIHGLKLYDWVRENGESFPRGEVFGYEQDGRETQCFLREVELYARLPTYAYLYKTQAVNDGVMLNAILLPDELTVTPVQIKKPPLIKYPLRSALLNWWQVPLNIGLQDLDNIRAQPDPGY